MNIEIIFEDEFIIVVNKPNNVLVHNSYYSRNIKDATLLDLLQKQLGSSYYPIHRLDRKTSGILMLAKKKELVAVFQKLFNQNEIAKTYFGIVRGFIVKPIVINTPVKNPDNQVYKDAETFCKPLKTIQLNIPVHPYKTSRYTLVNLKPATGRMHQLRIHMNKISHPIVGDYKYGDRFHNRMFEHEYSANNLFLHAFKLAFKHPLTAKKITFEAPFPKDWMSIFANFNWKI